MRVQKMFTLLRMYADDNIASMYATSMHSDSGYLVTDPSVRRGGGMDTHTTLSPHARGVRSRGVVRRHAHVTHAVRPPRARRARTPKTRFPPRDLSAGRTRSTARSLPDRRARSSPPRWQGKASYGGYLTWDDHPKLASKPKVGGARRSGLALHRPACSVHSRVHR